MHIPQPVWHAARASGAAPTYFRACGRFLDGGLISNNPTLDILTEIYEFSIARQLKNESVTPVSLVVSMGTGRIPITQVHTVDIFRPHNPLDVIRSAMGITSLGRILVEMATMSEG
ncbi:unnamed protein product [Protopolystoma xenopodis]|uniref:PNPLA domain-containing protein n=1 Tax=Protopolystoma xenopodis TaxID=117903 RepID=A0A448XJ92_9PLAT|nr:unnamed protein product [Protopolystoma xenopodis]